MRSTLFMATFAATLLTGTAPAAAACVGKAAPGMVKLEVIATGLRNNHGETAITLYPDDAGRFLKAHAKLLRARVPSVAPETEACFWVAPGFYAVAQYHDENDDHDFNRTLFAPKEGYGFSNDAPTTFGIPRFAAARFRVAPGGSVVADQDAVQPLIG